MTRMVDSGSAANRIDRRIGSAESIRVAIFLCVGAVGLAVDMAFFSGLSGMGVPLFLARLASIAAATGVTYGLNRGFTFAASGRATGHEFARYALVTLAAQGFSYAAFLGLVAAVPALPPLAALVAGSAAATVLSFTGQRLFTFRGA